MPRRSPWYKKLKEGNNILVVAVVVVIVITLVMILGNTLFSKDKNSPINEDQIMIQKGGSTIIVNKNGLIEYRSGDEVFYKTWDSTRIDYFFGRMQSKARDYVKSGMSGPCEGCYTVTLYVDGKLVTIYISDDEDLDEAFEDFPDEEDFQGVDLGDYFDDEEGDADQDQDGYSTITPSPTITVSDLTPTPITYYQGSQEQTNYPPVEAGCAAWSQDIVDKAIISNTLCTVVQE